MPMIDCPWCGNEEGGCRICEGTGRVPDDFFPEDSEELSDPDEEPEEVSDEKA